MNKEELTRWKNHPVTKIFYKQLDKEVAYIKAEYFELPQQGFDSTIDTNRLYYGRGQIQVMADIINDAVFSDVMSEEDEEEE